MQLTLSKIIKTTILSIFITISVFAGNQPTETLQTKNFCEIQDQKSTTTHTKLKSWLIHNLAALAVCMSAKYGFDTINNSKPMIEPLASLQNPRLLQLDDSSIKTLLINHWIAPLVSQYNDARTNTVNCINENINSTNTTIEKINQSIKTTCFASLTLITVAALYGIYKHYKHLNVNQPAREILFKIYRILTNQQNKKFMQNDTRNLVLELQTVLPKYMQIALYEDLTLLKDDKVAAKAKIQIIQRILAQYQF